MKTQVWGSNTLIFIVLSYFLVYPRPHCPPLPQFERAFHLFGIAEAKAILVAGQLFWVETENREHRKPFTAPFLIQGLPG